MEIKLDQLRKFVPLDAMSADNLTRLLAAGKVQTLPPKKSVFKRGDTDSESVYLISGELELEAQDGRKQAIRADSEQARYPIANLKPRQFTGRAKSESVIFHVSIEMLDKFVAWDQIAVQTMDGMEVTELESNADNAWMLQLLNTSPFLSLPTESIKGLFESLEDVQVKKDDLIIKQGDPGDYYYIIKYGRCRVSRSNQDGKAVLLNELGDGDSFGEEALISEHPRSASITMLTDGVLVRLAKKDFIRLLRKPIVQHINAVDAAKLVETEGAILVDTRLESEHENNGRLKGSVNIPLYLLRVKIPNLDKRKKYIVYCDTGARSAAATFIMADFDLDAYLLEGGLSAIAQTLPRT